MKALDEIVVLWNDLDESSLFCDIPTDAFLTMGLPGWIRSPPLSPWLPRLMNESRRFPESPESEGFGGEIAPSLVELHLTCFGFCEWRLPSLVKSRLLGICPDNCPPMEPFPRSSTLLLSSLHRDTSSASDLDSKALPELLCCSSPLPSRTDSSDRSETLVAVVVEDMPPLIPCRSSEGCCCMAVLSIPPEEFCGSDRDSMRLQDGMFLEHSDVCLLPIPLFPTDCHNPDMSTNNDLWFLSDANDLLREHMSRDLATIACRRWIGSKAFQFLDEACWPTWPWLTPSFLLAQPWSPNPPWCCVGSSAPTLAGAERRPTWRRSESPAVPTCSGISLFQASVDVQELPRPGFSTAVRSSSTWVPRWSTLSQHATSSWDKCWGSRLLLSWLTCEMHALPSSKNTSPCQSGKHRWLFNVQLS